MTNECIKKTHMNVEKNWKGKSNKTSFNFQYPGKTYSKQNCYIKEKKA